MSLVLLATVVASELVLQLVAASPFWEAGGNFAQYVPYVGYVTRTREDSVDGPLPGFVPSYAAAETGPLIWTFGGSTMRGRYTSVPGLPCEPEKPCSIASWLAYELNELGRPHRVWNLGQTGYRSHQERILFIELLARRERPEIAVFYDGVNEVRNASRVGGYPFHYQMFRDEVEWNRTPFRLADGLRRSCFKLAYLLHYVTNSRTWTEPLLPFGSRVVDGAERRDEKVADEVTSYVHNVRTLKAICAEFSVTCLFVWQPFVCDKATRTSFEEGLVATACEDGYGLAVHREVAERLAGESGFLDLRGVFADTADGVFLDEIHHIDEAGPGNRLIARAIAQKLLGPVAGAVGRRSGLIRARPGSYAIS